jgi:hypothetical protein
MKQKIEATANKERHFPAAPQATTKVPRQLATATKRRLRLETAADNVCMANHHNN